jgi:8-amino-3,8-dideoxy-alpha-D-manno-octulosonate transaminase
VFPLSQEVKDGLSYLNDKTFEKSDHFIGRNLSCLIKLSWTEAEVKQRAQTMAKLIREITA